MAAPPPDHTHRPDSPTDLGRVLAVVLAVAWLLVGVSIMLVVGGAWFLGQLLGLEATGQLDSRAMIVLGSIAVSVIAFRLAWLLFNEPTRRDLLVSLVAGVAVLGVAVTLHVSQEEVEGGPDLILAGLVVVVSGLAVWQRRQITT